MTFTLSWRKNEKTRAAGVSEVTKKGAGSIKALTRSFVDGLSTAQSPKSVDGDVVRVRSAAGVLGYAHGTGCVKELRRF